MKFFRITLVALAVVLGASALLAEQMAEQQGPSSDPETLSQMFPGPLEDVTFGKVVAGDFTGDGSLDAVVMDGDSPLLLVSPEAFDTAIPVQDESLEYLKHQNYTTLFLLLDHLLSQNPFP